MTLTIDQLRAWLERREREASEAAESISAREGSPRAYIAVVNRRDLCRELLAAIEKGELPDA